MKYIAWAVAAGLTVSANACTILEFATENLLSVSQNTPGLNFQELEAFAAGRFPTIPIFTGHDPRFEMNLNAPIDLAGFGYAVVHYNAGTSGDPQVNRGGSIDFYFIRGGGPCEFTFPQTGPGGGFSNGRITSVALFTSEPVPEVGRTVMLLAIALGALGVLRRFAKQ